MNRRFNEDRGPHYAALFAYYGFLSIFPLLLALVNILGLVLRNHPKARADIIDSAFTRIPVIGSNLDTLSGNIWAVLAGTVVALWAGMGAVYAMQHAMDTMWSVPEAKRPNFLYKRLNALAMLGVLGGGTLAATAVAVVSTELGLALGGQLLTWVGTIAINIATLIVAFDLLTHTRLGWRRVAPGAVLGGVALFALQLAGNWFVNRTVRDAQDTYGTFATVIGLLAWLALQGRIVLLAAEVNVVRDKRLWPRSLNARFDTEVDRRAREDQAARWHAQP